jgi:hypothetical protein
MNLQKFQYQDKIPKELYDYSLDVKQQRVAVLGAFDTWPYMHKICTEVVKEGFVAITSKHIYKKNNKTKTGYYRTPNGPEQMPMNQFLQEKVIGYSNRAIIVYSVPAAHYNEADWCSKIENFETLGIVFVREIHFENMCEDCIVDFTQDFAYCGGIGDAWSCVKKPNCPFKNQGIAKTQLEYFLNKENTLIIAVEKLEKLDKIVNAFLHNKLSLPKKYPYVFEFRIKISDDERDKLRKILDDKISTSEEKVTEEYEYIDYYYKPNTKSELEWFNSKRTIRIREKLNDAGQVGIYSSEIDQKTEGFLCPDPFGKLIWYEGTKNRAERLLKDHEMRQFLTVIKEGVIYHLNEKRPYRAYLEKISVQKPGEKERKIYGYSLEIEIWKNEKEDLSIITKQKKKILESLKLDHKTTIIIPVQEFIYNWA